MTEETVLKKQELSVQRAVWVVSLKTLFKKEFECVEHLNDYSTMLMLTHPDSPGWFAKVTINSSRGKRNSIQIGKETVGYSIAHQNKILLTILESRRVYDTDVARLKEKEAKALSWRKRQSTELGKLHDVLGATPLIIREGPHAGRYSVSFEPGNPLEHITLDQYKVFYAFLLSLDQ